MLLSERQAQLAEMVRHQDVIRLNVLARHLRLIPQTTNHLFP
jgi:hypothetical protein